MASPCFERLDGWRGHRVPPRGIAPCGPASRAPAAILPVRRTPATAKYRALLACSDYAVLVHVGADLQRYSTVKNRAPDHAEVRGRLARSWCASTDHFAYSSTLSLVPGGSTDFELSARSTIACPPRARPAPARSDRIHGALRFQPLVSGTTRAPPLRPPSAHVAGGLRHRDARGAADGRESFHGPYSTAPSDSA